MYKKFRFNFEFIYRYWQYYGYAVEYYNNDKCKNDARTKSLNFICHSSLSFVTIMCKNKEKEKKFEIMYQVEWVF